MAASCWSAATETHLLLFGLEVNLSFPRISKTSEAATSFVFLGHFVANRASAGSAVLDCNPFFEDLLKALPMRHKAATVKLHTELGLLSPGNTGKKLRLIWLYLEWFFFLNKPLP